jgi:eukaryotic-like serine/threonine-protein kinase
MAKISKEDWPAVFALLDQALDLPPANRVAWLDGLEGDAARLAPKLRDLLARQPGFETDDFLSALPRLEMGDSVLHLRVDQPDREVGPYRLIREIGQGGMGSVWLAERVDATPARQVALKLPHAGWAWSGLASRMERERDILASLEHPNIARLYEAGFDRQGRPYLALEYVEGQPIDAYCEARSLGVRARLALIVQVAHAVAHAHTRMVVHRDLKPGNILVTAGGEVRLLDFGIARLIEGERSAASDATREIGPALSLDYASPEQIRGEPVGAQSDVYSLAVVTYGLLSGERPYRLKRQDAASLVEAIAAIDAPPASVQAKDRNVQRQLRGDIDAILQMALRKAPNERYATVDAFAQDIERHLAGRAVKAQPDRAGYRLRKFIGRNRLPVGAASALALAIVVGATVSLWQAGQARQHAARAEEVKRFALSIFDGASIEGGGNQQTTAKQLLVQARKRIDSELAGQTAMAVEMLSAVGNAYIGLGEQDSAVESLNEAIKRGDRDLGRKHPLSLGARARLALAKALAGDINEAGTLADEAIAGLAATPRVDPEGQITAWSTRGTVYFEHGKQAEGVKAIREAVRIADEFLPASDKLNRVNIRINLVNALQGADDPTAHAEAERTYRMAQGVYRDDLSPMLLQARSFYADTMPPEQTFEAIQELDQTLVQMHKALGPQHFLISGVYQSLGTKRPKIGDTRGAVTAMRAYREMEDALQGDKPTYARAFARLRFGAALLEDGRAREAVAEMESAPAMLEEVLHGTDDGILDTARVRVAWALATAGQLQAADAMLAKVNDLEAVPPEIGVAKDLLFIGQVRRMQGRYADSARVLNTAQTQFKALGTPSDLRSVARQLAYTLVESGKSVDALPVLEEAWSHLRASHKNDSPQLGELAVALGRARLSTGDLAGAATSFGWASEFWQKYDPSNREGGVAAAYLARALDAKADTAGARELRRRASGLLKRDPRTGDTALLRPAPI